jgi:lipopolysaccharide/colanic/teichoic acid biosynthesis glycosyltransferase
LVARLPITQPLTITLLLEQIKALVASNNTHLILCAEKGLSVSQIMQLLELGETLAQEVKILSNKLNVLINEAGVATDFFMELPLVHFAVSPAGRPGHRMRQLFFRILASACLVFTLPFMLFIACLIKLSSPGPVFFMQDRIGINRTPFRMYKFRTMHDRAEELQAQIEEFNDSGEGLFKIRRDPRVTGVGRFLRRFSLDELPQLINVVRGEMTLVGPRPLPRRDFENYYEEWHYGRHSGLPGLTCLWQVSGRSDISFHNMCILDDYYLRNQNILLDLKIIVRTVSVVLFAKGAY